MPAAFPQHASCESCGAAITWERTVNGKAMPVDYEATPDGNIEIRSGVAHVVKAGDQLALGEGAPAQRFKSHFATCPAAAQHRKARS